MNNDLFPQDGEFEDEPEDLPEGSESETTIDVDLLLFLILKKEEQYYAEYYEEVVYSKKENAFVLQQACGPANTVAIVRNLIQNHASFRETLLTLINIFLYLGTLHQRKEFLTVTSYIIGTLTEEKEGYELTHIIVYNTDKDNYYNNIDIINDSEFQHIDMVNALYHETCFCKTSGISLLYQLFDAENISIGDYLTGIIEDSFELPSELAKEGLTQIFALN